MKILDMLLRRPSTRDKDSRELRLIRARNRLALRHVEIVLKEVDRVEKLIEER